MQVAREWPDGDMQPSGQVASGRARTRR